MGKGYLYTPVATFLVKHTSNIVEKQLLFVFSSVSLPSLRDSKADQLPLFLLHGSTPSFPPLYNSHPFLPPAHSPSLLSQFKPLAVLRHTFATSSRRIIYFGPSWISVSVSASIGTLSHLPRYSTQSPCGNSIVTFISITMVIRIKSGRHFAPSDVRRAQNISRHQMCAELRTPSWESDRGACSSIAL